MTERHQIRANWHDYNEGIFFVTICCAEKRHFFGEIVDGTMQLTGVGTIVRETIDEIADHFDNVEIWNSIVMPNHVHMVIAVGTCHGTSTEAGIPERLGCLRPKQHDAVANKDFHHNSRLAVIINQLKGTVTRECNKRHIQFAWQPRYHEHIIQNDHAYENIMYYIDTNIENWCYDRFNASRIENVDAPWRVPTATTDHEA